MNRKIVFIFFSIFFSCLNLFSQKEIFIGPDMKEIDSVSYYKKCNSLYFKCKEYKTASLLVHKLSQKYKFGRISEIENNQIRQYLSKIKNIELDNNSYVILKKIDTLLSFESYLKKPKKKITYSKNIKVIREKPHTEVSFYKGQKKYFKKHQKCLNKMEKYNPLELFYIYRKDNYISNRYPNLKWVKDNGIFKNTFFKVAQENSVVVLKPNGEYFTYDYHLPTKMFKKLIKNEDWTKFKNDLEYLHNLDPQHNSRIFINANPKFKDVCF